MCYVQYVDKYNAFSRSSKDASWHELYDGRFGYIAAGHHPQINGQPKMYNYSCNLDTACYHTGVLTGRIFNYKGAVKTISVKG